MPPKKKEEEREENAHFAFPDGSSYDGAFAAKKELISADGSGGAGVKRSSGPTSGSPKGAVGNTAAAATAVTAEAPAMTVVRVQHGHGIHTDASGAVYCGQWRDGQMTGDGALRLPTGSTYKGAFHEGLYHGVGKYTWPDGSFYEGLWSEGSMHGNGVYVDSNGRRWYGQFAEGFAQELLPEVML